MTIHLVPPCNTVTSLKQTFIQTTDPPNAPNNKHSSMPSTVPSVNYSDHPTYITSSSPIRNSYIYPCVIQSILLPQKIVKYINKLQANVHLLIHTNILVSNYQYFHFQFHKRSIIFIQPMFRHINS